MKASPSDSTAILLFAKYPIPGQVKTRLQPSFDPHQSARIQEACCRAVWSTLESLPGSFDPILVFSPDQMRPEFIQLLAPADGSFPSWPQGPGTLGSRLTRGFARAFGEGYARVLAIGTDSPMLPRRRFDEAAAALEQADLCLGPTEDGGYYLLGLRRLIPAVFDRIDWRSDQVAAQTRERAAAEGLRVKWLPVGYDLDRPEDLARLMDESAGCPDHPGCAAVVNALRDITQKLRPQPGARS